MSALAAAVVTAYIATCSGCSGTTASGLRADHRLDLVAASRERPLGSCVEIEVAPEEWRAFLVADRGAGLPPGGLDVLVATRAEAIAWGRRLLRVRPAVCSTGHARLWATRRL